MVGLLVFTPKYNYLLQGGVMLRTKFFSSGFVKIPSGTMGLFNKNNATNLYTYNFGSDAVAATTSLPATTFNSTLIGTSAQAIIVKGSSSAITYKYGFPSTAVTTGSSLTGNVGITGAINNSTVGIIAVGGNSPYPTNKYTYSGDLVTAGGNLTYSSGVVGGPAGRQAYGNATVGVFPRCGTTATNQISKYTYAGDISAVGTTLLTTTGSTRATGISTMALICYSTNNLTTAKYTYADDTVVAGSTFTLTSGAVGPGAGNDTLAIFANGTSGGADSYKYVYVGDLTLTGTTFGINQPALSSAGAASNGVTGVNV
jgi:hypothetical protein